MRNFYKGFSTRNYEDQGTKFGIYDVDCVQEDILNEIHTVKGERLYMPDYGTRIPLLTFEPNDENTANILKDDIVSVLNKDPRVQTIAVDTVINGYSLFCIAKVRYVEFDVVQDFQIEIKSR